MVPAPEPLLDRHLRDPPRGIDHTMRQRAPPELVAPAPQPRRGPARLCHRNEPAPRRGETPPTPAESPGASVRRPVLRPADRLEAARGPEVDRKSTRLNSSH